MTSTPEVLRPPMVAAHDADAPLPDPPLLHLLLPKWLTARARTVAGEKGRGARFAVLGVVGLLFWGFIFGVLYRLFPQAAASRLAALHFWLYQTALPLMMVGLTGILLGEPAFEPLVAAGSTAVGVAIGLFAWTMWRRARASTVDLQQLKATA